MKEEILLLKINKALIEGKNHYESTRKHWIIKRQRTEFIQYVAGFNKGKLECVFQPTKWDVVEEGEDKGRLFFEGVEAPLELLRKFQCYEDILFQKFGSGNPVAYATISELE